MSQEESPGRTPRLAPVRSATSTRRIRQASIGSVVSVLAIVGILLVASSLARPSPSTAPVGDAGVGLPSPRTSQAATPFESMGSANPSSGAGGSTGATPHGVSGPMWTPWRSSPPSTCDPYKKPCDPTVYPQYDYVSVIIGSATDNPLPVGKVTFTAGGQTHTCTTMTYSADCYWDIPPGVLVVATVHVEPGTYCTRFELLFEDYTGTITHRDCSPITFTTRTLKGQLYAELTTVAPPPTDPPPPTEPPLTPSPTPDPTPTPEVTLEATPAAS